MQLCVMLKSAEFSSIEVLFHSKTLFEDAHTMGNIYSYWTLDSASAHWSHKCVHEVYSLSLKAIFFHIKQSTHFLILSFKVTLINNSLIMWGLYFNNEVNWSSSYKSCSD